VSAVIDLSFSSLQENNLANRVQTLRNWPSLYLLERVTERKEITRQTMGRT